MRKIIEDYIQEWKAKCYFEDIPDEVPKRLDDLDKAPSYKRICMAVLRNDYKLIGYTSPKSKYYDLLKRIELKDRGDIIQLDLFQ